MTKIFSVFPGMGKTTIYNNAKEAGIKVADSDSSLFSWVVDKGEKIRNPDFPANYIKHIRETIGTVDYLFVSTHKEVIEALIAEDIEFTIVRPVREHKPEYLNRYRRRQSPEAFVDLMDSKWDTFMNDLDGYSDVEMITVSKSTTHLSEVLGIDFRLNPGTRGIYVVNENDELTDIVKSYICYRHHSNVPSILYIGDWDNYIKQNQELKTDGCDFVLIKNNFAAMQYLEDNNIEAKILRVKPRNALPPRELTGLIHTTAMSKLTMYHIESLASFLQLNFPMVRDYKMIINSNDFDIDINTMLLMPIMNIGKKDFDSTRFEHIRQLAAGASKVLYVLDAGKYSERDIASIGILYGQNKSNLAVLLITDKPNDILGEIIEVIHQQFDRSIVCNQDEALLFMSDWN